MWSTYLGEVEMATQPGQGLLGTGSGSAVPSFSLEVLASEVPTIILQLLLRLHSLGTWEALTCGVSLGNSELR